MSPCVKELEAVCRERDDTIKSLETVGPDR